MITTKKDEVKASPFKITDDQTPIVSLILHIIGQQFDHIEEKIVEKTVSLEKSVSVKTEKPLIDLPSQDKK